MTRSASSRTACSTSASLYLLPERDAARPGEARDFVVQRAGVQQHVYRIAARGALAGERREPREERMADLVRRHHRERQAVLVDHGVDDLALALPDLRESIEHVPVAEHAAGLVEVALLAGENAREDRKSTRLNSSHGYI